MKPKSNKFMSETKLERSETQRGSQCYAERKYDPLSRETSCSKVEGAQITL
jgi:hypothetical protein